MIKARQKCNEMIIHYWYVDCISCFSRVGNCYKTKIKAVKFQLLASF